MIAVKASITIKKLIITTLFVIIVWQLDMLDGQMEEKHSHSNVLIKLPSPNPTKQKQKADIS